MKKEKMIDYILGLMRKASEKKVRNRCCSLQSMRYDSPYFDRFHQHRKGEQEMKNCSRIKEPYDGGFAEMYLDL